MSLDIGCGGLFVTGGGGGGGSGVAIPRSANLGADLLNGVQAPVYNTLLSVSITTLLASSYLKINFYVSCSTVGGGAARKAPNVRFRLNGSLIPASRGCTENELPSAIVTMSYTRRLVVTAGVQLVVAEWAYFGAAGATLQCRPATIPDLEGAQLILEEQL